MFGHLVEDIRVAVEATGPDQVGDKWTKRFSRSARGNKKWRTAPIKTATARLARRKEKAALRRGEDPHPKTPTKGWAS